MKRTLQVLPHFLLCTGLLSTVSLLTGCLQNLSGTDSNQTVSPQAGVVPTLVENSPDQSATKKVESHSIASDSTGTGSNQPKATKVEPGKPKETALSEAAPSEKSPSKKGPSENAPVKKAPIKATRVLSKNSKIAKITFDDLKLEIKEDMVFQPKQLTDRVNELVGKIINVSGFIHPGSTFKTRGITQFILIRNLECKFGPGGQFHHNLRVDMKEGLTTSFTTRPVNVEGVLSIKPYEGPDGKTWSIYYLECNKVK